MGATLRISTPIVKNIRLANEMPDYFIKQYVIQLGIWSSLPNLKSAIAVNALIIAPVCILLKTFRTNSNANFVLNT
jgi:hypothetical protein